MGSSEALFKTTTELKRCLEKGVIIRSTMKNLIFKILFLCSMLLSISMSNAQQFDQSYLKWKAEQEAQDAKLKGNDPNHYLSKPSVENKKSSNSSVKTSANVSGKIRLNSATVGELQQLNGVGEKKAQAILDYRQQNGKFKTVDELQNVKGIGPKLLEKNKDRLSL